MQEQKHYLLKARKIRKARSIEKELAEIENEITQIDEQL